MKPGEESQTAVMVCLARAVAHGSVEPVRFSDPTALVLLPDEARRRVENMRARAPRGFRDKLSRAFVDGRAKMMVARTVAVDDSVRESAAPQLVILGAGLDGRAFRMRELADRVVFEVDHPDSQRVKRERAAKLVPLSRKLSFVPVDFSRDDLDVLLGAAGHDAALPTTWIWEGVVMYLTPAEVDATLAVVARRSAPGSRLIVAYLAPALMLHLVGLVVRRVGEPLKSTFTAEAMRDLLAKHDFRVVRDLAVPEIGATLSPDVARGTRRLKHMRIVTADSGRG